MKKMDSTATTTASAYEGEPMVEIVMGDPTSKVYVVRMPASKAAAFGYGARAPSSGGEGGGKPGDYREAPASGYRAEVNINP